METFAEELVMTLLEALADLDLLASDVSEEAFEDLTETVTYQLASNGRA